VVAEVVGAVFEGGTGADAMDQAPGDAATDIDLVRRHLADPEALDRLVGKIREFVGPTADKGGWVTGR
jgi:hypothetical protein